MTDKEEAQVRFLNTRKMYDGDLNEIIIYLKKVKIQKGIQELEYLSSLEGLTIFEMGYIKHLIKTADNNQ